MDGIDYGAVMSAHLESVINAPFSPPAFRHYDAVPTYLENWPAPLQRLSIAQIDIPLTIVEATALGSQIHELGEGFAPVPIPSDSLIEKIERAFESKLLKTPVFVRLGSRSPKDAFWSKDTFEVHTAEETIELLTASSERIYEDLKIGLHYGYEPHIFLREWLEIPEWAEFRCVMKDRKLISVSQYYYRKLHRRIIEDFDLIEIAIHKFFNENFKDACHLDDVVFDVFIEAEEPKRYDSCSNCCMPERKFVVKLLEINPYWDLTDPCLFTWPRLKELASNNGYEFRFIRNNSDLIRYEP